jgi:NAD(P)H-flavin reductase
MATSSGDGGRLHQARLEARAPAGGGLTLVTIDTPRAAAETYVSPGQYVEVRAGGGKTGYFVLASEPGAQPWELIMKSGGGVSDVLLVAAMGTPLEVTDAIGVGFPLDRARGRTLVVALGGTGIAAGRPIVNRRIREGDHARTHVLVGVRQRAELALEVDLDRWSMAGVEVVVCLSQSDSGNGGNEGSSGDVGDEGRDEGAGNPRFIQGYLQTALRALGPKAGTGALVFAVGPSSMVDALRSAAPQAGIAPDDVLTNH